MKPDDNRASGPFSRARANAQPFATVLSEELEHLRRRRKLLGLWAPDLPPPEQLQGTPEKPGEDTPDQRLEEARREYGSAHLLRPLGLAFSGGGIRSATFNLGLAQGLAEKGLLPYVDYLSTVSGGGYIGSWLHGLIRRDRHRGDPREVAKELAPSTNPLPETADRDSVSFLRKYSNYLAPKLGLFSADLWVMGLIWLRNVLLNQLILIPAIMTLFFVILLAGFLQQMSLNTTVSVWISLLVTILAITVAGVALARNLTVIVKQTFGDQVSRDLTQKRAGRSVVMVPLMLLAAVLLSCSDIRTEPAAQFVACLLILISFVLLQTRGGFRRCYIELHKSGKWPELISVLHILWMSPLAASFSIGLLLAYWNGWAASATAWETIAYGPPLVGVSLIGGISLLTGLMGVDYPDAAREWAAETGATLLIWFALWSGLFTLAVFGPWLITKLLANYGAVGASTLGAWLMTTIGGVLVGRSAASTGTGTGQNQNAVVRVLASVAPTVFMLGYLLVLAVATHSVLRALPAFQAAVHTAGPAANFFERHSKPFSDDYAHVLDVTNDRPWSFTDPNRTGTVIGLAILSAVICLVSSSRFNINEFSLHHFYKNRLVRAYLGASNNRSRQPNALTGFDATDDFPLSSLSLTEHPTRPPYCGPYAIVNAALNLNTGSELAKQERKAASFTFTPDYCGFEPHISQADRQKAKTNPDLELHGYRSTLGYGYPAGPSVGTVMAISGAAANPNSGYHTSGPMAFMLTVFDARMGWWLGNPRRPEPSTYPGPVFALRYLMDELFARTNGRSKFVNLSDGGHFDNLGLYELVRRRCRYIIVGDSEEDGGLTFGSLGGAIRMCRADFGVEIDLDPAPIRLTANGFSKVHCVVGTIRYPEQESGIFGGVCSGERPAESDDKARGWLLYLKSSLTGDEPSDVVEYRSRCPKFPHESTGDQFFSESQFESYRRLGLHIIGDAFEDVPVKLDGSHKDLLKVFQSLTQKWYSPVPVSDEAASRLADAYTMVMRRLSEQEKLKTVFAGLLREDAPVPTAQVDDVAFAFGLEIIQLMENVFTEFRMERGLNRANPRNAGWMGTFRRWAKWPPLYDQVWQKAKGDYNPVFQQFITNLRSNAPDDVPQRP